MKKNTKLIFLTASFFLAIANSVFAFEVGNYPTVLGIGIGNGSPIMFARYFFNLGIYIAGILAAIVIAFGGVYYLVSFGRGKFTGEAKEWIKAGVLGLLLIMCSYLIAYTINPDLVIFRLDGLLPAFMRGRGPGSSSFSPGAEVYSQINLGGAIENAIVVPMHCYDFDSNGDPISQEYQYNDPKYKGAGPTLLDHDPADCYLKLAKALNTKVGVINKLGEKISDLMKQCNCSQNSSCDAKWASDKCNFARRVSTVDDCKKTEAADKKKCTGSENCICNKNKKKPGTFPPSSSPYAQMACDSCPTGVREQIENGPIKIIPDGEDEDCKELEKSYKGLTEFRNLKDIKVNEVIEKVTCGNFYPPDEVGVREDESTFSSPLASIMATNEDKERCIEMLKAQAARGNKEARERLNKKFATWNELNLMEQFSFLKQKTKDALSGFKTKLEGLNKIEGQLASCYLPTSYVDFIKQVKETDEKAKLIQPQKSSPRYCKNFAYDKSLCFNFCQQECPNFDFECAAKNCEDCGKYEIGSDERDECLVKQTKCINDCRNSQKCNTGSKYSNFGKCIDSCFAVNSVPVQETVSKDDKNESKGDLCNKFCEEKNPSCSNKFTECVEQCSKDSVCITDNYGKCIIGPQSVSLAKECFKNYSKNYYTNECTKALFTCKSCSSQNAGYNDCLKIPYIFGNEYSSSFIADNKNAQVCKNCYDISIKSMGAFLKYPVTCVQTNPETAKCPSCSNCPNCPCLQCGAECNEYAYNDDPLIFYCKQSWWDQQDEKGVVPLGSQRYCSKEGEIPVGQAMDASEAWLEQIIASGEIIDKKAEELTTYINKIINDAQVKKGEYCQCDSKCTPASSKTLCQSKCEYKAEKETITSPGSPNPTIQGLCHCVKVPCSGQPCQKMITLLTGEKDKDKNCADGTGFKPYYDAISKAILSINDVIPTKIDIVKMLTYSRTKINSCSVTGYNYGKETKLLPCERVEDEIISPITEGGTIYGKKIIPSYCYGKQLGKILNTPSPMADNWFCCEEWKNK